MKSRYIFKKWDSSPETCKCGFCCNQTLYFITDIRTGEESWCCLECALKKFKIKRLKNLLRKYPIRKKKSILEQNLLIKKSSNQIPQEFSSDTKPFFASGGKNPALLQFGKVEEANGNE